MQQKFSIRKNTVKSSVKVSGKQNTEIKSSSITKKAISDGLKVSIISATNIDTTNYERLKSPIDAEYRRQLSQEGFRTRRRRAIRDLTLKSAPPIPTAPKDPHIRRRQWLISQTKAHISLIDIPTAVFTIVLSFFGLLAIFSATRSFGTINHIIIQSVGIMFGTCCALILSVIDYRSLASKYRYIIANNASLLLITFIFGSSVTEGTNSNWIDLNQ